MVLLKIEAESQEEYDSKKKDIIKALTGQPTSPRKFTNDYQNELFKFFNMKFSECIDDIKKDIDIVLDKNIY